MRLRIEAEPGELASKSHALIDALAKAIEFEAPKVAEALASIVPEPPLPTMKFPVLQDLLERSREIYASQMVLMLADIAKVLDRGPPAVEINDPDDDNDWVEK